MTHEGGCLCGAVRYAVRGPLREILVCHCVECRRWAGHAMTQSVNIMNSVFPPTSRRSIPDAAVP